MGPYVVAWWAVWKKPIKHMKITAAVRTRLPKLTSIAKLGWRREEIVIRIMLIHL